MASVIYLMGAVTLLNCGYGLLAGRMYYFFKAPDEFIGSMKFIDRQDNPLFFWIFMVLTAAFGTYLILWTQQNF